MVNCQDSEDTINKENEKENDTNNNHEKDKEYLKNGIKKANDSEESEYEYDQEEDEEAEDSAGSSPDRESDSDLFIKKKGVVPKGKDKHGSKAKEMMSFIAYPSAIESSCKLVSQNKNMTLSEE